MNVDLNSKQILSLVKEGFKCLYFPVSGFKDKESIECFLEKSMNLSVMLDNLSIAIQQEYNEYNQSNQSNQSN